MNDDQVFEAVEQALIWAKQPVLRLTPGQVSMTSQLSDHPICLDSLESIAMVTRLEELVGLVAEDEHFFAGSVRTVADVVASVKGWLTVAQTSM